MQLRPSVCQPLLFHLKIARAFFFALSFQHNLKKENMSTLHKEHVFKGAILEVNSKKNKDFLHAVVTFANRILISKATQDQPSSVNPASMPALISYPCEDHSKRPPPTQTRTPLPK